MASGPQCSKKDILENFKLLLFLVGSQFLTFRKYHIQASRKLVIDRENDLYNDHFSKIVRPYFSWFVLFEREAVTPLKIFIA